MALLSNNVYRRLQVSKWIPLATPVVYSAATLCYMVYKVAGAQAVDQAAGVQVVVNQVGGTQVVDEVAGAQVVDEVAGAQVVDQVT